MKKSAAIGFLLALAAIILVVGHRNSEPKYQGRTLTSWLEQYSDPSIHDKRLGEAEAAVRAMDPAEVLPKLLEFIQVRDSRFKTWLTDKAEEHEFPMLHGRDADKLQRQGIAGIEILGTNGAPAVGKLNQLLDDKDCAVVAVCCLEQIGRPAETALCRGLTNQDWQVRQVAVTALAGATDDVEVYIARIKDRLNDSELRVRQTTVSVLGLQTNAPELAVPLLITALADTNINLSANAATTLSAFGTNAATAFPTLVALANTRGAGPRGATLNAMVAIDPAASLPILSNLVVSGPANQLASALQAMETIAPELSHTLTLAAARSEETARRMYVLSVLKRRDPLPPGFSAALKAAAADSSPEVARRATTIIHWILETRKADQTNHLQLPDEPSYQGRSLGEWLETLQVGGEFSTNTVNALRQMDTNVIPALVARVNYHDPEFGVPDSEVIGNAAMALIALGDLTLPALPNLTSMMDSRERDCALWAMTASIGTGSNAVPCLVKGLTNQIPDVRNSAIDILFSEWSTNFPALRNQARPLLEDLLNDPDENVRTSAASSLDELDGPNRPPPPPRIQTFPTIRRSR